MSAEPLGFASPAGNGNDSDFDYNYSTPMPTPNASNATYSTTAGAPTNVQNIVMYVLVAVDGIGCALNVLVFLVLIQLRRRGLLAPMPHLMLGQQAFWDAMSLALAIVESVDPFLAMFMNNDYDIFKAVVCLAIYSQAIYYLSLSFSVYNHVLLGIERLFAIMLPLKYPVMKRRFWIVLIIYYLLIVLYSIPALFRNVYDPSQNNCNTSQVHDEKIEPIDMYNVSTVLFYYLIPLLALATCSTAVVLRLRADSRAFAHMSAHASRGFGSGSNKQSASGGGTNKAREASAALVRVSIAQAIVFLSCTSFANVFVVLSALDIIPVLMFSPLGDLTILSTNVNMALDPLVYFTFLPALRARLLALLRGHRET